MTYYTEVDREIEREEEGLDEKRRNVSEETESGRGERKRVRVR